jgi:glycosyl transferase, family 25
MPMLVINLDQRPDRLARFSAINGFLAPIHRFPAVDGRSADRQRLIAEGLADAGLVCNDGALGCAISHGAIWRRALKEGEITVFEDDAVVNRNFDTQASRLIAQLPPVWDMIYWGWNFDAPLVVDLLPGITPAAVQCNQQGVRQELQRFQALDIKPWPMRLFSSCGTLAYTVSARGAVKLLRGCFPLRPLPGVTDPRTGGSFYGIDLAIARLLPTMSAFVAVPPLAVSPNEDTDIQ